MRSAFVTVLLLGWALVGSLATAADIAYDRDFSVRSEPKTWSIGSQVCFAVENKDGECAKVTNFGEIKLREDSNSAADVYTSFIKPLSAEDQKVISGYRQFVVRHLSLDGDQKGRYIVQVLRSVVNVDIGTGPGSQAVYLYGNFDLTTGTPTFEPMGYGEAGFNFKYLRRNQDDQDALRVAQDVIRVWASQNTPIVQPKE